ncbi:MAG: DUF2185 domain-containing protein [Bacteroidales bacterium]|nr:DUF2185 domain-containing protein [Bacteroidales bacterium]
MRKIFKLNPEDIKQLVEPMGSCLASDKITIEGFPIGYMYREDPEEENDSGWRFLSGTETQDYIDDPNNSMVFEVNTVANYDTSIIPYLKSRTGMELERVENSNEFTEIK